MSAQTASKQTKAEKDASAEIVEKVKGQEGTVMEMAADRETFKGQIADLQRAVQNIGTAQTETDTRLTMISGKLDELTETLKRHMSVTQETEIHTADRLVKIDKVISQIMADQFELEMRVDGKSSKKVVEEPLVGNFVTKNVRRASRFVKRELKPSKPDRSQMKAVVVANVAEYFVLVGAAQMAPVAVGNAITAALFI